MLLFKVKVEIWSNVGVGVGGGVGGVVGVDDHHLVVVVARHRLILAEKKFEVLVVGIHS